MAALPDRALHIDRTAVTGDEFTGDGQAQSGAFLLAGEVRLEDLADVLALDASPIVRHDDLCQRLLRIE